MSATLHETIADAALLALAEAANELLLLDAVPASAEAARASALARMQIAPGALRIEPGAGGMRLLRVAEQRGLAIGASGRAQTVALIDQHATRLLLLADVAPVDVAAGDEAILSEWTLQLASGD